ncbi:methylated-DNA--[protein]-cysteine S-methyltransferase [Methylocystis parvus]|uniref:methylated-DNA--[protein]-cysteine S-methyltransferase n=1 Tax=Methylocystis parvus TaxID=134 RepID=A0A6B8M8G7_9HYPH|nr:methylated-DNA--[protein]-cysteine S-methyltransferase [Methylocystis parvus]QGM97919.1 methylated-DNA--[protein]-cysteine S-methyltransferase [Methylocystis parvus]WBK01769.1 methylated-DNA--[protein]-cysteine S-methyltransferase [Methylocystis parvus OBBP]
MTATHVAERRPEGRTPQKAEAIRYGLYKCSLGLALVATSDKGVCSIWFGDDADVLRDELRARFRDAALIEGRASDAYVAAALALIENPSSPVAFPVDARGTKFQRGVWAALCAVPPGETASYADIAKAIGAPTATRAVAGACAANPVAIAIPCHRILRSDGALSGYRGGVARKRELLEREKSAVNPPR